TEPVQGQAPHGQARIAVDVEGEHHGGDDGREDEGEDHADIAEQPQVGTGLGRIHAAAPFLRSARASMPSTTVSRTRIIETATTAARGQSVPDVTESASR